MKQYFSWDSTIFTIISIWFVILGHSGWLFGWMLFTLCFILLKPNFIFKSKFGNISSKTISGFFLFLIWLFITFGLYFGIGIIFIILFLCLLPMLWLKVFIIEVGIID